MQNKSKVTTWMVVKFANIADKDWVNDSRGKIFKLTFC